MSVLEAATEPKSGSTMILIWDFAGVRKRSVGGVGDLKPTISTSGFSIVALVGVDVWAGVVSMAAEVSLDADWDPAPRVFPLPEDPRRPRLALRLPVPL